jgi:hypothetical protein
VTQRELADRIELLARESSLDFPGVASVLFCLKGLFLLGNINPLVAASWEIAKAARSVAMDQWKGRN